MMSESRLIEDEYNELLGRTELLEQVVEDLGIKDENIYKELFNTSFPDYSLAVDTLSGGYISHTSAMTDRLAAGLDYCGRLIETVMDSLAVMDPGRLAGLPAIMPIVDFPLGNVGASVGRKMHPFYKKVVYHGGLDLVAPVGVEVRATADGRVKEVERAQKLQGTRIVIDHGNGYETVYAHLSDLLVRKGQRIHRGDVIGRTGNSGTSFAPHLHYEVILNGVQLDPLNYFNGELDTERFGELLVYAVNTGQSLD